MDDEKAHQASMMRRMAWDGIVSLAQDVEPWCGSWGSAIHNAKALVRGSPKTQKQTLVALLEARVEDLELQLAAPEEFEEALAWYRHLESEVHVVNRTMRTEMTLLAERVPPNFGKRVWSWEDLIAPGRFKQVFDTSEGREINLIAHKGAGKSNTEVVCGERWLQLGPEYQIIHNVAGLEIQDPSFEGRVHQARFVSQELRHIVALLERDLDSQILDLWDEPGQTLHTEAGGTDQIRAYNKVRPLYRKLGVTKLYGWQQAGQVFPMLRVKNDPSVVHAKVVKRGKDKHAPRDLILEEYQDDATIRREYQGVPQASLLTYDDRAWTARIVDVDLMALSVRMAAANAETIQEILPIIKQMLNEEEFYLEEYRALHGFTPKDEAKNEAKQNQIFDLRDEVVKEARRFYGSKGFSPSLIQARKAASMRDAQAVSVMLNHQFNDDLVLVRSQPELYKDPKVGAFTVERLVEKAGFVPAYAEILVERLS